MWPAILPTIRTPSASAWSWCDSRATLKHGLALGTRRGEFGGDESSASAWVLVRKSAFTEKHPRACAWGSDSARIINYAFGSAKGDREARGAICNSVGIVVTRRSQCAGSDHARGLFTPNTAAACPRFFACTGMLTRSTAKACHPPG